MLRALELIPTLPYPPRSGGHLRAWNLCDRLSTRVSQTVLCRVFEPVPPEHAAPFANRHIDLQTVLIPRPQPAIRVLKGLRLLFSSYPIMAGGWDHRAMRRRLTQMLATNGFDLVALHGSPLCVYMPLLRHTRALKVVHLYDLETEFLFRQAKNLPTGIRKLMMLHDAHRMRRSEARLLRAADLIIVTSERERQALLQKNPHYRIATVPNGVDCQTRRPLPPAEGRELLYVGSLSYAPNEDAVLHFASAVWPALHARFPEATFRVVGRGPSERIRRLHGRDGIHITGEVDEVEPYYRQAALCVVPLRVGGGTRLKILEAFAFGRPVVSTTLGCEGLDAVDGRHLLVGDTPAAMSAQIARVLQQPDLAGALCANGRALIEQRYSWDRIADGLHDTYVQLVGGRTARR